MKFLVPASMLLWIAAFPALAQTVEVTFGAGEWSKTIPGIPLGANQNLRVLAAHPGIVCYVPSPDIVKRTLQEAAARPPASILSLPALLQAIEAQDASSAAGATEVFRRLAAAQPSGAMGFSAAQKLEFSASGDFARSRWSAGESVVLRVRQGGGVPDLRDCLSLADAQAFTLQVRRIIRAHLQMPPPALKAPAGIDPRR
jgi:hypothetical protein